MDTTTIPEGTSPESSPVPAATDPTSRKQLVNYVAGSLTVAVSVLILATTHKVGPRKHASVAFFYQMTTCALLMGAVYVFRGAAISLDLSDFRVCQVVNTLTGTCILSYMTHMLFLNLELYLSVRDMTHGQRSALGRRAVWLMSVMGNSSWLVIFALMFGLDDDEDDFSEFSACDPRVLGPLSLYAGLALFVGLLVALFALSLTTIWLISEKTRQSAGGPVGGMNAAWLQDRRRANYTMVAFIATYVVSWCLAAVTQVAAADCDVTPCHGPMAPDIAHSLSQAFAIFPMICNGVVYIARNKKIRVHVIDVLPKCGSKCPTQVIQ